MDQNLLIIIAAFVFVAAAALCIQAGLLFGILKTVRELEKQAIPLLPKADALMESSRVVIDDSRQQIHDITVKTNEILDAAKIQLARVNEVLEDATARAHIQLEHAEMVIDDAMSRTQETVALVHSGIMTPLREIQGVTAGVRAAIQFLMRGRRSGVQATADEEMFI
ncbi:MAG TPA: hypothetical protein VK419_14795 [Bryobacteraceae bacterium]|nr:hypothetical protein [Bryobacteraceae bacterium]